MYAIVQLFQHRGISITMHPLHSQLYKMPFLDFSAKIPLPCAFTLITAFLNRGTFHNTFPVSHLILKPKLHSWSCQLLPPAGAGTCPLLELHCISFPLLFRTKKNFQIFSSPRLQVYLSGVVCSELTTPFFPIQPQGFEFLPWLSFSTKCLASPFLPKLYILNFSLPCLLLVIVDVHRSE